MEIIGFGGLAMLFIILYVIVRGFDSVITLLKQYVEQAESKGSSDS